MNSHFRIGDLVTIKKDKELSVFTDMMGKPLLVINVTQMAVGESVVNVYKTIHGTKVMSNLHGYDLDLLEL